MFIRGRIGARLPASIQAASDPEILAAIHKNWLELGKMSFWNMFDSGFRIIGPKFQGLGMADNLMLELYGFPSQELFTEWTFSPEHEAGHRSLIKALNEHVAAGGKPPAGYNFHATDEPGDIRAKRADLRKLYAEMEKTEWINMPPGSVQAMMLGDDEE